MKPFITFIACAHNEEFYNSPFIDSMLAQTNPNWKAIIYNNGPITDTMYTVDDPRISYERSPIDTGNWGTANRASAIKYLVDTEYVVNTSIQDYYLPCTVQLIADAITAGADMIHWQAISHLFNYNVISGEIAFGHLDWGQWTIKTEYIKQTGIVSGEQFCSDFYTIQEIIRKGLIKKSYKVDKILTIHN